MPRYFSQLDITTNSPKQIDADLLLVPTFSDEDTAELAELDGATGGEISRARGAGEFKANAYDVFVTLVTDPAWRARRIALVGCGRRADFTVERARKAAAAGGIVGRTRRVGRVAFLERGWPSSEEATQAIAEGLILGQFDGARYKTTEERRESAPVLTVAVPGGSEAQLRAAAERAKVLGECSNLARELANEPSNVLTPRALAEQAQALAGETGVSVEVLDERAIGELGMGLLLGVARGSAEPPRLIVLRHEPHGAPAGPVLGLVGKGITFDTGGISIKPADGMERMKDDMAGGAAVICAMRAIGALGAPVRVVGIVPATENMPGGRATKPGDVLTSASGKTVEVVNTDAEGRLVLADGLWYAQRLGATHLVDIATLTGACVVALGHLTTGLFGSPPPWVELVRRTADRAGDRAWPMPLFDDYREQLRSEIADLVNTGGRPAASITAALFLKEFAGELPWCHLDIAGTAWAVEAKPYQPKGASGVGVRTLAELAFTSEQWPALG